MTYDRVYKRQNRWRGELQIMPEGCHIYYGSSGRPPSIQSPTRKGNYKIGCYRLYWKRPTGHTL